MSEKEQDKTEAPEGTEASEDIAQETETGGMNIDAAMDETPSGGPIAAIKAKLKIILLAVGVIAIMGGAAGIYLSGLGGIFIQSLSGTPKASLELPGPSIFHEMPVMTVDLKPSTKRKRAFIRFVMTVEVSSIEDQNKIISDETKVLDAAQSFLRDQTTTDISGKEGTEKLREGMIKAVNSVLAPNKVITVLFKEILVR